MEVNLRPDLQARLAALAAQQGRDSETLACEAIRRLVDYGVIRKAATGQIQHGISLTRAEIGARIEKLLAEKKSRAPLGRRYRGL